MATPILNVRINTKSSIILIILAIIKNTSGVLLSPSERSILENGVRRSVATSIILGIAVTIVMTAISVLAARPLLEIMKTPSDIIDDSYKKRYHKA